MLGENLGDFFDTSEFARTFTRRRSDAPDVVFAGIFGVIDELAMDSHLLSAEYELRYPTAAVELREKDLLIDGGGEGFAAGTRWLVRENPRRVLDGSESHCKLSSQA